MSKSLFAPTAGVRLDNDDRSTIKPRLQTPVKCYTIPSNATHEQRSIFAFACALSCSGTEGSLSSWKNLLFTYTHIMFDGIVGRAKEGSVQFVSITAEQLHALCKVYSDLCNICDAAANSDDGPLAAGVFDTFCIPGDVPKPASGILPRWVVDDKNEKTLYAHYSLVVFLAGKLISDTNRSAITVNRPRGLIEKFKITTNEILNKNFMISDRGHYMFNQAWLESTSLKSACFEHFARFSHTATTLPEDIVNTNVILMRFMQMQHAFIIDKFLQAYPWAAKMSVLRQSIQIFEESVRAAADVSAHLQPYIKIIWGDKNAIFPRKDLGPLIACAVAAEREIHETLAQYYSDDKYTAVVEAFHDERSRLEAIDKDLKARESKAATKSAARVEAPEDQVSDDGNEE
jgi:hypothetical protein